MYETIRYDVADPIATITLNRPDRLNAITGPMVRELQDAFGAADADERVVGIVLTGEGRGFCAGADIGRLKKLSDGQMSASEWRVTDGKPGAFEEMGEDFQLGLLYLMALRKPTVDFACPHGSSAAQPGIAHVVVYEVTDLHAADSIGLIE